MIRTIIAGMLLATLVTPLTINQSANAGTELSAKKRVAHHHHRVSRLQVAGDVQVVAHRSSLCASITGRLSCGCDTAIYFGVRSNTYRDGRHDLDLASNWGRLPQASGPCVGCAAWRSGHVMAITGGGPGGWVVRDSNSGGGATRVYTTASLSGYRFAHPADLHLAEGTKRRHYASR